MFWSDHLELIPHLTTLFDPLIQQIGFALKTSLEIDGNNSNLYADSIAHALVVHLLSRYSTQMTLEHGCDIATIVNHPCLSSN